jgi:hypothetical protein
MRFLFRKNFPQPFHLVNSLSNGYLQVTHLRYDVAHDVPTTGTPAAENRQTGQAVQEA